MASHSFAQCRRDVTTSSWSGDPVVYDLSFTILYLIASVNWHDQNMVNDRQKENIRIHLVAIVRYFVPLAAILIYTPDIYVYPL